jgi:excinuclease ABC subunit A
MAYPALRTPHSLVSLPIGHFSFRHYIFVRMAKPSSAPVIRLRGVRHNNLKNFDLDLPLNQLIVITGLSGSGKSSLAFDTLFAEGQRRYIETFSPYARQFFDRMDKPQVDAIEGIPPAIAIEQRNAVKSTRSTVGTMTEICDHMKLLWPHIAQLYCRQCGQPVRKESPQQVWESITAVTTTRGDGTYRDKQSETASNTLPLPWGEGRGEGKGKTKTTSVLALNDAPAAPSRQQSIADVLITFTLPVSEKLSLDESLALIAKQGYQRLLLDCEILRLEDAAPHLRKLKPASLTILQDRVKPVAANRARFIEACEQAYHFGKGKLAIYPLDVSFPAPHSASRTPHLFSNRLHCATCDIEYREPSPALFSFNHPLGACPACRGFGRIITIDYNLALPDKSKTLAEGVVKPWQSGQSAECQDDLMKFCRIRKAPTDVPFRDLPKKWQDWVINGDPDYGKDTAHQWPRAWYGIKGYFRWLESKSYKMHVRVLLSRYRSYVLCPDCKGQRLQPEALLYKVAVPHSASRTPHAALNLADFYLLPIRDALRFVEQIAADRKPRPSDPLSLVLNEVRARLGYLNDVGLGYLTLDRPTRSLSGGETERVNLTTCLGTRLVNTLFVLDEPSVGLHPRDTNRLVRILESLRSAGNTVVVVEHEASVMRAADQIVDIGPGHGASGGQIVFQGPYGKILKSPTSLTGQYLSGARTISVPPRRPTDMATIVNKRPNGSPSPQGEGRGEGKRGAVQALRLAHATLHNLRDVSVEIPLGRFVCLTGVSGSGKTTLAREILLPLLNSKLNSQTSASTDDEESADGSDANSINHQPSIIGLPTITGWESLGRVVLVDQSILAKTPRSNPAVYIGAFDDIRELFAHSELAQQRGLAASAFSFNSAQGQCERCRGAGFEKIEMQFLSDIFIRCPECNGRRYRPHILEIKLNPWPKTSPSSTLAPTGGEGRGEGAAQTSSEAHKSVRKNADSAIRNPQSALSLSIADLLDATVDEAIDFLSAFSDSKPAERAATSIKLLQQVGLGYLRLGQPINTLSGGESQRLKLVRHLAEFAQASAADAKPTLFVFDEPTTGLHFDDVRILLHVFQRLVDAGHSVLIIEHNLDVIKSADWIIDLGPDAGDQGGQIVACGTPEQIAKSAGSHTGLALREVLSPSRNHDATKMQSKT